MDVVDLTGQKFGMLTVICRAQDYVQENGRHRVMWLCECECGNTKVIKGDSLKSGAIRSCGCLAKALLSERQRTHGMSKTHLYGVWCAMKSRCSNPNATYFCHYGGRGIQVCREWEQDFQAFSDWAFANGYREGVSIDRIDNDKGYSPDNCKWVSVKEQSENRRSNLNVTFRGETKTLSQWCNDLGLDYKKIHSRIKKCGWTPERAFTT